MANELDAATGDSEIELHEAEPWERQPAEPDRAWESFRTYRDLRSGERSLAKAARILGKSKATLEEMSVRDDWRARVEAYDRELDRQERAEQAELRREANERHRSAAAAAHGLAMRRIVGDQEGGIQAIDPNTLSATDTVALIREGFRQERVTLGMATDLLSSTQSIPTHEAVRLIRGMADIALDMLPEEQHEIFLLRVRMMGAGSGA
jgi:hypothetical protein